MATVLSTSLTSEQLKWLDQSMNNLPESIRYNPAVRSNVYEIDGKLYVIFYRGDLSNHDYTQHQVYDVLTQEEKWGKCQKGIATCLNDTSLTAGQYQILNEKEPSFANYLRKYHRMEYIEKDDVMRYTIITPYDD